MRRKETQCTTTFSKALSHFCRKCRRTNTLVGTLQSHAATGEVQPRKVNAWRPRTVSWEWRRGGAKHEFLQASSRLPVLEYSDLCAFLRLCQDLMWLNGLMDWIWGCPATTHSQMCFVWPMKLIWGHLFVCCVLIYCQHLKRERCPVEFCSWLLFLKSEQFTPFSKEIGNMFFVPQFTPLRGSWEKAMTKKKKKGQGKSL